MAVCLNKIKLIRTEKSMILSKCNFYNSQYIKSLHSHIEYMPSGEQFSEQRDNWATPYKFNSKELDAEIGESRK